MRWGWHVLVATALAVMKMRVEGAAANIDQGFTQDGVTTYCQGVTGGGGGGPVTFMNLEAHNVGRCPVEVSMTVTPSVVHPKMPMDVTWKAKVKPGEIKDNIFPAAVDQKTKKAQNVVSSLVKACKAGTNCAVVLDPTPAGPAEAETGPFDASGSKELRAFKFMLPDVGDYVIVAKVVLPGDASLNVSATEFVAFKKVTVLDPGVPLPPAPAPTSPAPTPANNGTNPDLSNLDFKKLDSDKPKNGTDAGNGSVQGEADTITSPDAVVPAAPSDAKTTAVNEEKGFLASHGTLLIAVVAGTLIVVVIGYMVVIRRRAEKKLAAAKYAGDQVFRVSHTRNPSDPEEPMPYVRKQSARSHSEVPMMCHSDSNVTDDNPIDRSHRGSEMDASFDEGTITASNHAIKAQPKKTGHYGSGHHSSSKEMPHSLYAPSDLSSLDDHSVDHTEDRDTQREFFQSEAWNNSESMDEERETDAYWGESVSSYQSQGVFNTSERMPRMNSEASVDSYAFRPSDASVAESYQSRVSRYSQGYSESESDRESSRSSGISIFSDRHTSAKHI